MNLTRAFVDTLLGVRPAAAEARVRNAAADLVLDGIAVSALGAHERGPAILASLAPQSHGPGGATLVGFGRRSTVAEAARVNGASMHVLDYEPMWNPANHSLSTTLPALLALAEMSARGDAAGAGAPSITGGDVLGALALGIEAQERMRAASGQFEPGELGFHPPGAVGALGSAFACGLLLALDAHALTHALGIAASRACGIQGNVGSMTKALHCGQAALSGLEAAMLAARGFTADADALAGPRGYGRVFYGEGFTPERLLELRPSLFIVEPGPAFKFYPSQFGTHFVITAAIDAHRRIAASASAAAIRRVRITTPPMPYVDRPAPPSGLAGKFSFQYTAAIALLDGDVTVESFSDRRRFAPDAAALLERIAIEVDPGREGRFDRMRVDIHIDLDDGRAVHACCDGPPGVWGRPVEAARIEHKARACLEAAGYAHEVDPILQSVREFAQLAPRDVMDLFDRLRSPVRAAAPDRADAAAVTLS